METIKTIYKIGSGPSSSHTMGPENAVKLLKKKYKDIDYYKVYLYGSLALTGKGHLTDKVIQKTFGEIDGEIIFDLKKEGLLHPNQFKIQVYKNKELIKDMEFVSVGGGNIQQVQDGKIKDIDNLQGENLDVYEHTKLDEIINYCNSKNIDLVEYVRQREENIEEYLEKVYDVMDKSINRGIHTEGVIPGELGIKRRASKLYKNYTEAYGDKSVLLSAYAYAVNEENACGGEIVTAPTCGASGTLPAVLKYYETMYLKSREKIINALMIAGLIGTITRHNATISGAEGGCQAEVGTATAMAAAAVMYLMNPSTDLINIDAAAEIGLAHQLGLTCDPVLGYVQVPCIQRNPVAANKALLSAKLAKQRLDDEPTSFDAIVEVMYETGKDLKSKYRETSTGGIAKYYKKMYLKEEE